MKREQLAINSVSTGGATLEERLSAYSKAGFKLVEFQLGQVKEFLTDGKTVADARKQLDAHGLKCIGGFETSFEVFSSAESREKNHATVLANARLIADLGGTNFVVGTDGPPAPMDAEKLFDTFASAFECHAANDHQDEDDEQQGHHDLCRFFNSPRHACEDDQRCQQDHNTAEWYHVRRVGYEFRKGSFNGKE